MVSKTLPRTSQKNGKGHQNGYGQMSHRGIVTENVVYGEIMERGVQTVDKNPTNPPNQKSTISPIF